MQGIQVREYAHPFDRPIEGEPDTHGVSPSSDAIGGYYGMGWYQHFEDHQTGERYAQVDRSLREGLIGHSRGLPVIVDPSAEPALPERTTLVYAESETAYSDNGRWATFSDLSAGR